MLPFNGPCAQTLKSSSFMTFVGKVIIPVTFLAGIADLVEMNCQ